MKNTIIILMLALVTSCKAQIYPLNTSPGEIPANAYLKDIDGVLDKYIGLWKGNWNGKTVYLELRKIKTYPIIPGDTHPYYKDRIYGERKVISQSGQIEIDRISNFDDIHPEFSGVSNAPGTINQKRISFYPKNMCGLRAGLNITNITSTTMTLHMVAIGEGIKTPNCIHDAYVQQHGEYPWNFPKDITLIKQ